MATGKSGKYYRSSHIARKMGDAADESPKDDAKWDDLKRDGASDGEKLTIEKTPEGFKSTHEGADGPVEREHPDLQGALDHAKEALGDGGDEDMPDAGREPMADKSAKPSGALAGLNSLVG